MRLIRKIHKWTSVVVGIQFLLWLLSGLYFNVMDHSKSAARTYRNHMVQNAEIEKSRLIEPKVILQQFQPTVSLALIQLLDTPYYLLTHQQGLYQHFSNEHSLVNAYNGNKTVIDEVMASQLAQQSYNGPGEISSTLLIKGSLEDFPKEKNNAWQINFADEINTSVYVDAHSGRIIGHSDDNKRLADLFFMVHFMDYGKEGSFNNFAIIAFAFMTLWLSLTGLIWTIDLGMRGQYKLKRVTKSK